MTQTRTIGMFWLPIVIMGVVSCADIDPMADAGVRDASTPDLQVAFDASDFVPDSGDDVGARHDASSDAAGALDSAADVVSACPGTCRPDEGFCRDFGACVLWEESAECVPIAGRLALGSPCEQNDQCMAGLACFAGPSGGACQRICCRADPTACHEDEVCGGSGMLVDGTMTPYGQCGPSRSCSLLSPGSCGPGEACYMIRDGRTECRLAGSIEVGNSCTEPADCAPGLGCVGAFDKQCARNCRVGAPNACPPGEGECRAYANSPEGTGLCSGSTT